MSIENRKNLVDPFAYIRSIAAITILMLHTKSSAE